MRLLVYGMQSSGATAFTRMLAERPGCVALADIPNNFAAPRVNTGADFVAKVVMTTAYPIEVHRERFRPDATILFLRDPRRNYASLRTTPYRNHSGWLDEKFELLDRIFARRGDFDAVIHYEHFVARDPRVFEALAALGWPVTEANYSFRRDYDELLTTLWEHEPQLRGEMDVVFGSTRGKDVVPMRINEPFDPEIDARLEALCPDLLAYYRAGIG
jgi:hypothetical protein